MTRCTGHCCESFVLNVQPETLREWIRSADWHQQPAEYRRDVEFVADMVIEHPPLQSGERSLRFRCRHHDAATGDCTVYEQRPMMCRSFGCSTPCTFVGCTLPQARGVE